jgi:hypothetical protein
VFDASTADQDRPLMARTPASRDAIASHVAYEIRMMWASGAEMMAGTGRSWAQRNALVEVFAVHTRNLIDFFYGTGKRDDVVAADFFSDKRRWQAIRPALTQRLRSAKKRANKEMSHLTYSRLQVAANQKGWDATAITRDFDSVLQAFFERADLLPDEVRLLKYKELLP